MIKVIALDIYGTVLASDDAGNELPLRKGIEKFFEKCGRQGIKIVTSSDADIVNLKIDLKDSFRRHNLEYLLEKIDNYYQCIPIIYKNFRHIVEDYKIKPGELLVIGDTEKDVGGAREIGACWFKVPEYFNGRDYQNFDLSLINF